MCGIAGLSRAPLSSISDGHRFVLAALIAIEHRGFDSTGVAWIDGANTLWFDKAVGRATEVAADLNLACGQGPLRAAVMHTRWSTQGEHTYDNAHPVVAENIALVHNGVVTNDAELDALAAAERIGEVDSWALAGIVHNATAIGAAHPCDVLALVQGDAAVAWLDSHDPSLLHLARLNGRPMAIGWTKRGDLVMSSTPATLRRTATLADVWIGDVITVPTMTYLAVRDGKIVEWRTIGKAEATTAKPERKVRRTTPVQPVLIHDVPDADGKPRHRSRRSRRGWKQGITDLVENRPADWWDEAERLLGDDWADAEWPSGTDLIRDRPRNEWGW